jgi:hypothetical protein
MKASASASASGRLRRNTLRLFLGGGTSAFNSAVTGRCRSVRTDCSQILRWGARAQIRYRAYPASPPRVSGLATCATIPARVSMVQRRQQPGVPRVKQIRRLATVMNGTRSRGWVLHSVWTRRGNANCLRERVTDCCQQPTPAIEVH